MGVGTTHAATRGFTLVEMMVVVAVAGIVMTAAAPSLNGWVEQQRLSGIAGDLARDLRQARQEAVMRNESVRFTLQHDDAGAACYLLHTGGAGDCRCAATGPARCDGSAQALKQVQLDARQGFALRSSSPSVVFSPAHGTVSPTATLRLQDRGGRTVQHAVNLMGRVRSCAPLGAVSGYPAC
jgi:type IV fimbrial biogenesis protein FimT